jgi:glycogen operon protein
MGTIAVIMKKTSASTKSFTDLDPGPIPWACQGARILPEGTQFVLFSRHATAVSVLLYDDPRRDPARELVLDPARHRRGDLWSVLVPGVAAGQIYAYRVDGPKADGHRFDRSVILLDPWAKGIASGKSTSRKAKSPFHSSVADRPKSVVVDDQFDWEGDRPLQIPLADAIIYEAHVRGLTMHASAGCRHPGTYRGLIDKIPYLKDLGVTTLELLPIHEFDYLEFPRRNPLDGKPLVNYWGYSSLGFFSPNARYASSTLPGGAVAEFKTMVRELHKAGIEVILDVVYNHTGEGNHDGPTISFRGIDNLIYYHVTDDGRYYKDYSGCGNSLNCNHPVVRDFILASLRYWVVEMHVDGFRFDLASVLARDTDGHLQPRASLIESISEDPILRDSKIIAEPWDAAGAYQVGHFPGRWAEWNGRFRDDVRQFWRGDPGRTGLLATRLTGSSDLYQRSGRRPFHSINFVTCHDGFTLGDLVSYDHKHNTGNGEDNRDGENNNNSYNYGWEGPTDHPDIERVRLRQMKNMLATLLLSQGVPMILAGDEFRRTQLGNNNAYCQDNEISWIDWNLIEQNYDLFRFARSVIWFRRQHPIFRRTEFFAGRPNEHGRMDVMWLTPSGEPKDWSHDDQTLACVLDGDAHRALTGAPDDDMLILFNARPHGHEVRFRLPGQLGVDRPWQLFLDTSYRSPMDVFPRGNGPKVRGGEEYPLLPRSMAVFHRPHTE